MKLTVLMDNNTYIDQYYLGEPAFSVYIAYKRLSSFYIRHSQGNCRHPHYNRFFDNFSIEKLSYQVNGEIC